MNAKHRMWLLIALLPACTSSADQAHQAHAAGNMTKDTVPGAPVRIELSRGEVLTVAVSRHRDGAEPLMKRYFESVMPIAGPLGFAPKGALDVVEARAGGFHPNNFVGFYGFPSTQAATDFAEDPRWPAVRATRPQIWSELRISHYVVTEPMTWSLRPDRVYEVRYAWGQDAPALAPDGGQLLVTLREGAHEMLPKTLGEPSAIQIIEWPNLEAAQRGPRPKSASRIDSLYTRVAKPAG